MTMDDLMYIFGPQINEGTTNLYFMLNDHGYSVIERHSVDDITGLLPMLCCFEYSGTQGRIPRFSK